MIRKVSHYNHPYSGEAPVESHGIEEDGHALLKGVFSAGEITELRSELERVYAQVPPDWRPGSVDFATANRYRYELFNRSPLCQAAIGRSEILDVLDPLLGGDCHAISCTSWKDPGGQTEAPESTYWHVDGGPYIARPPEQAWPENIPYPIFVISTHIYLQDVELKDGPTAILPGSHRSGQLPPFDRRFDCELTYEGHGAQAHLAKAGDVSFFVSDSWHRRLPPTQEGAGRFFLQTAFGRREIAQRVRLCENLSPASPEAAARAKTLRERQVLGLHEACFYDG